MPPNRKDTLLDIATKNKPQIQRWLKNRPSIDKTYDDLLSAIKSDEIGFKSVPEDEWEDYATKETEIAKGERPPSAFYRRTSSKRKGGKEYGDKGVIHYPEGKLEKHAPHELMHYFSSHTGGRYGVPEINPYIKADMDLKGWLPSLHPAGRRPTLPDWVPGSKGWNEKHATKQVEYSNKGEYHPWFDAHAFKNLYNKKENKMAGIKDILMQGVSKGMEGVGKGYGLLDRAVGGVLPGGQEAPEGREGILSRFVQARKDTYAQQKREQTMFDALRSGDMNKHNLMQAENVKRISNQPNLTDEQRSRAGGQSSRMNEMASQLYAKNVDVSDPDSVKRLQGFLQEGGYYKGNIDSMFGPKTELALRQAQYDSGSIGMGPINALLDRMKEESEIPLEPDTIALRAEQGVGPNDQQEIQPGSPSYQPPYQP